jgi:hypothetical protein
VHVPFYTKYPLEQFEQRLAEREQELHADPEQLKDMH